MSIDLVLSALVSVGVPLLIGYAFGLMPGMFIGERLLRSREIGHVLDALKTFAAFVAGFAIWAGLASIANGTNMLGPDGESLRRTILVNAWLFAVAVGCVACVGHFVRPWRSKIRNSRIAPFAGVVAAAAYLGIVIAVG